MGYERHYLLLLGAGFSRNWGGWLAAEADEYLLGHKLVDQSIRDILWQHRITGGFEAALGQLQDRTSQISDRIDRLNKLSSAVTDMFKHMNDGYDGVQFHFSNERKLSISEFLARFDAIFTLNQDLLLEKKYVGAVELTGGAKWSGCELPGIKAFAPGWGQSWLQERCIPAESNEFKLPRHSQPYVKLHGSANWVDDNSNQILVVGGNKTSLIEERPLLKWYHQIFDESLKAPNTRLMVIGYSFRDPHINRVIQDAVKSGLELFVVDPGGTSIIGGNGGSDLLASLWPQLRGASRRSLREIFVSDRVEYEKIMRFFS